MEILVECLLQIIGHESVHLDEGRDLLLLVFLIPVASRLEEKFHLILCGEWEGAITFKNDSRASIMKLVVSLVGFLSDVLSKLPGVFHAVEVVFVDLLLKHLGGG